MEALGARIMPQTDSPFCLMPCTASAAWCAEPWAGASAAGPKRTERRRFIGLWKKARARDWPKTPSSWSSSSS
jgi:hypothetical protein